MTNRTSTFLTAVLRRLERAECLDRAVVPVQNIGRPLLGSSRVRSLLSGTPLGHPAHPVLVDLPIGFWTSAMVLDRTGKGQRRTARRLVGMGVLSALPAAATGWSDWLDTAGAESRVGLVHAGANATAVGCFAVSWWARRRGGNAGQAWSLTGATVATVGGWLGGHLAYTLGVGVDTNAFETGPDTWAPATGALPPDGSLHCVTVDGVRVAAVRTEADVRALADRCSHRGGPLSDGRLTGGCVTCPWHGSTFDLRSGIPTKGPASAPQPVYEARMASEGVELRRDEPRALRKRTVRSGR